MSFKKTSILIIRGISLSEILNVFVPAPSKEIKNTYCEIPRRFCGVDNWPKFTNLLCWTCHRVPSSYPKFLPKNPEIVNGRDECEPIGNFCEWPCTIKYIREMYPVARWWDLETSTLQFAQLFADSAHLKSIPCAPNFRKMKIYCGNNGITDEQYQVEIDDLLREIGGDQLGLTIK